jgi:hypothetical protein
MNLNLHGKVVDLLAMLPQPLSNCKMIPVRYDPCKFHTQLRTSDSRQGLQWLHPSEQLIVLWTQLHAQTSNVTSSLGQPLPNLVGRAADGPWHMDVAVGRGRTFGKGV